MSGRETRAETASADCRAAAEAAMERYGRDSGFLIPMLQDLQHDLGYLPREALEAVAEALDVPLSQCYSVATFYRSLTLRPRGKHLITLCLGTVCYLKGGKELGERIERELGVGPGGTTEDGLFTFQPVNCLGACALAPVMVVDETYYERVKVSQVRDILAGYGRAGEDGGDGDR